MNYTHEKKSKKRCYNCLQLSDCWHDHGPEFGAFCFECELGDANERRETALRLFKVLSRLYALNQHESDKEKRERADLEVEKQHLLAKLGK